VGLFRDQPLSDRISFVYQHWDGRDAARDLLDRVDAGGDHGVVVLALDGENPWESYPDAGEAFMTALFGSGRCVGAEVAAAQEPAGTVKRLHTGSWIGGTLGVWAGDETDRLAPPRRGRGKRLVLVVWARVSHRRARAV
jgi:alpha-amylase/alpha-mannosidase (GH57 family)